MQTVEGKRQEDEELQRMALVSLTQTTDVTKDVVLHKCVVLSDVRKKVTSQCTTPGPGCARARHEAASEDMGTRSGSHRSRGASVEVGGAGRDKDGVSCREEQRVP